MKLQLSRIVLALLCLSAFSLHSEARPRHHYRRSRTRRTRPVAVKPISRVDSEYLTKDAQGSVYDQATAELAAQKATSYDLHAYGIQLIGDHARLNQAWLTLARQKGLTLPVTLADADKSKLDGFTAMSGSAFDRAIIAEFVRTNGEDVRDGRKELSATRDPQVRRAVADFVATESKHLRQAQALQRQLTR